MQNVSGLEYTFLKSSEALSTTLFFSANPNVNVHAVTDHKIQHFCRYWNASVKILKFCNKKILCYLTQCCIADYLNKLTIYYLTAFDEVKLIHSKTNNYVCSWKYLCEPTWHTLTLLSAQLAEICFLPFIYIEIKMTILEEHCNKLSYGNVLYCWYVYPGSSVCIFARLYSHST